MIERIYANSEWVESGITQLTDYFESQMLPEIVYSLHKCYQFGREGYYYSLKIITYKLFCTNLFTKWGPKITSYRTYKIIWSAKSVEEDGISLSNT